MTALSIVFIPEIVQAIDVYTSITVGVMVKKPKTKELQRGIVAQGLAIMLGSLIGDLPAATYGQNVGIVIDNKVI